MANKTMHHVVIGEDTYEIVDQYAREHGASIALDTTLTESGKAADAKAVGDAIAAIGGGGGSVIVDPTLSPTSTHPVQNKAIYARINAIDVSVHKLLGVTEITTETDYNALLTVGEYYVLAANTSKLTNSPVTAAHRITVENLLAAGVMYVRQTVRPYNDERVYTRRTQNGGSSWSAWSVFVGTVATTSANGLMSAQDKSRLDDLYDDYSSALVAMG